MGPLWVVTGHGEQKHQVRCHDSRPLRGTFIFLNTPPPYFFIFQDRVSL